MRPPPPMFFSAEDVKPKGKFGRRADCADNWAAELFPPEFPGERIPIEVLGENFSYGIGVDDCLNAHAGPYVAAIGEIAQRDLEAARSFLDAGFGKACGLKELARNGGVAGRVQGERRFGLIESHGG